MTVHQGKILKHNNKRTQSEKLFGIIYVKKKKKIKSFTDYSTFMSFEKGILCFMCLYSNLQHNFTLYMYCMKMMVKSGKTEWIE